MTLTVSPGELWEDTGDDVTLRRITLWTLVICCVRVNFFIKGKLLYSYQHRSWPRYGARLACDALTRRSTNGASEVTTLWRYTNLFIIIIIIIIIKRWTSVSFRASWIRGVRLHINTAADRGAEYCDERVFLSVCVCVFVCPQSYLRTRPIFTNFCACYVWP